MPGSRSIPLVQWVRRWLDVQPDETSLPQSNGHGVLKRQDVLSVGNTRQQVVDPQRCQLVHPAPRARGASRPRFAGKRDPQLVSAATAVQE